jgi:hypothetical protein
MYSYRFQFVAIRISETNSDRGKLKLQELFVLERNARAFMDMKPADW